VSRSAFHAQDDILVTVFDDKDSDDHDDSRDGDDDGHDDEVDDRTRYCRP